MDTFEQILSILGFVIRALGFSVLGYGVVRFTLDAYYKAVWQVQIAIAIGFFAMLIGLTNYSSPASMGTFAIGASVALFMQFSGKKEEAEEESSKKK